MSRLWGGSRRSPRTPAVRRRITGPSPTTNLIIPRLLDARPLVIKTLSPAESMNSVLRRSRKTSLPENLPSALSTMGADARSISPLTMTTWLVPIRVVSS